MENGVMIVDKIEALPAIVIILFFAISLILFVVAGVGLYKDVYGLDLILLLSAISMSIFTITVACGNVDRYKIIISEETKLEKFYVDWDVKSKEGNIYYVVPQSKDSIKMVEEYESE